MIFERKGGCNHPWASVDRIIFSLYVLQFFIRFLLHFSPPPISWFVKNLWVLVLWVLLWIDWWRDRLFGSLHTLSWCSFFCRDPSWSCFEFIWENPNKTPTFSENLIYAWVFYLFTFKLKDPSYFPLCKLFVKFETIMRWFACSTLPALLAVLPLSLFCEFAFEILQIVGQFLV
jgi:hypothetical protein